jgi:hypothetical protein
LMKRAQGNGVSMAVSAESVIGRKGT